MKLHYVTLSILLICVLIASPSQASSGIVSGTVILAKGVVTATGADKNSRVLAKGVSIEEGDLINTANKSFAVIRMLDNTKLTLKPGTTVAIGKFSLEEGKEEACINLVKGGLRTVTGLIGKRRPDSFSVDTPIASIGIRGTDFITRICAGDECLVEEEELSFGEFGGSGQSQSSEVAESINEQLPEGLYGSCETGAIVMSKCAGQAEDFQIGSCRVTQQKDCTEVGLGAGTAGYASFDPVSSAPPSNKASTSAPSSQESSTQESSSGASSSTEASSDESSQEGSARPGSSAAGSSTGSGSPAAKGGDLPSKPVVLSSVPRILGEDPHFKLSDATDAELDGLDLFPEGAGSGGGQCSVGG